MENKIVYRHVRLDNNEVFYIGIGSKYRANQKYNRNKFWRNIVSKTKYRVDILAKNLTDEDAKELEVFLIGIYGRRDLGSGTLCNLTDGGDGGSNYIKSEDTKNKIRNSLKGRKISDEARNNMCLNAKKGDKNPRYKVPRTKEVIDKIIQTKKDNPVKKETKRIVDIVSKEEFESIDDILNRKLFDKTKSTLYSYLNGCRPNLTNYRYL
jgi:hypothetical protein